MQTLEGIYWFIYFRNHYSLYLVDLIYISILELLMYTLNIILICLLLMSIYLFIYILVHVVDNILGHLGCKFILIGIYITYL